MTDVQSLTIFTFGVLAFATVQATYIISLSRRVRKFEEYAEQVRISNEFWREKALDAIGRATND